LNLENVHRVHHHPMDLQHIVHQHIDQIMNEIKNIHDVHLAEINVNVMENHQKSNENEIFTYHNYNLLVDIQKRVVNPIDQDHQLEKIHL